MQTFTYQWMIQVLTAWDSNVSLRNPVIGSSGAVVVPFAGLAINWSCTGHNACKWHVLDPSFGTAC